MGIIVTELSRYLIVVLMALYAYYGFRAFSAKKKKRKKLCKKQRGVMYLFHGLGHLVLYLNTQDFVILQWYGIQLVFLIATGFVYKFLYKKSNLLILNHMQMFFTISMVMLMRLNVETAKKQLVYMAVGVVACIVLPFLLEHYRQLEKDGWFYAVLSLLIMVFVFIFGTEKYGAKNWLSLGPVVLQPSEFVKIFFVVGFAGILSNTNLQLKNVVKISIMAGVIVLVLVMEKDLGAALIFFMCYLFMLYVATGQAKYLLGGVLSGSVASVLAYFLFRHVRTRVMAWQDPWSCIDNQGYQVAQSLFAIGTGGWFGMGLTQGMPNTVPIRESDFIFAAISEELGGFFAICLILLYLSCFINFVGIITKAKRQFHKLMALGFSVIIMFQTFLTMGGVTKFIPSTGVTLPMISAGGSSMLSMIVMFCAIESINIISDKEMKENYEASMEEEGNGEYAE